MQMGILRSQVNLKDLELLPDEDPSTKDQKKATGAGSIKMAKSATISTEINLIGMHVEDVYKRQLLK